MKLRDIQAIHLLLLLFLIINSISLNFFEKTDGVVLYAQLTLFVVYFWVLIVQIKLNGLMHLFTVFLILFFLFLLGIPFFDLIGLLDIKQKGLFHYILLSNLIFYKVYAYSTLFLAFTFLGVLFGNKNKTRIEQLPDIDYKAYLYQVGVLLMLIALPGLLTKYYIQILVVLEKGYLAIYDGTLHSIKYPIISKGSGTILLAGFCIALSSKPNKRQYLFIAIIFLLTQVMNILKGQRSVLIFPLVITIWFYFKFYIKKVPTKKLIIIALCVIVLSQVVQIIRSNRQVNNKPFIEKYITDFFTDQGVSFFVFPYMLHYEIENNRYPYILAPLDIRAHNMPQNMERLEKFNFLPDQLMYKMLPRSYKIGFGVGSSILAVFYDLPFLIAMLLCVLFGYLITRFEIWIKKSRILLLFSYYIIFAVISSPRYELLQGVYDIVMLFVFFSLVILFQSIFQKKNSEYN